MAGVYVQYLLDVDVCVREKTVVQSPTRATYRRPRLCAKVPPRICEIPNGQTKASIQSPQVLEGGLRRLNLQQRRAR